jgi:hypothetical protein
MQHLSCQSTLFAFCARGRRDSCASKFDAVRPAAETSAVVDDQTGLTAGVQIRRSRADRELKNCAGIIVQPPSFATEFAGRTTTTLVLRPGIRLKSKN